MRGFKSSADSKGSKQLALQVKPREEIEESEEEREGDRSKEGSVKERGGDASGHKVSLVTSATKKVVIWWMIVWTAC